MEVDEEADKNFWANRSLTESTENSLLYEDSNQAQIEFASHAGVNEFSIFLNSADPNTKSIPKKPIELKTELEKQVKNHDSIKECIHTRNGKLLLKTNNKETALQIAEISEILNLKVVSELQQENITSQFILQNIPTNLSLKNLSSAIEQHNLTVASIRRFTRKGSKEQSETVLVKVYGQKLPTEIKVFFSVIKINKFVDKPRQCQKCFKFNHSTKKCTAKTQLCKKCGEEHEIELCTKDKPTCINCKEDHLADNIKCVSRKEEEKFLKFKAEHNLSFSEARRTFKKSKNPNSYSEKIKSHQTDVGEQLKADILKSVTATIKSEITTIVKTIVEETNKNFESKLLALQQKQDEMFSKVLKLIETIATKKSLPEKQGQFQIGTVSPASPGRPKSNKRKKNQMKKEETKKADNCEDYSPNFNLLLTKFNFTQETDFKKSIAESVKERDDRKQAT